MPRERILIDIVRIGRMTTARTQKQRLGPAGGFGAGERPQRCLQPGLKTPAARPSQEILPGGALVSLLLGRLVRWRAHRHPAPVHRNYNRKHQTRRTRARRAIPPRPLTAGLAALLGLVPISAGDLPHPKLVWPSKRKAYPFFLTGTGGCRAIVKSGDWALHGPASSCGSLERGSFRRPAFCSAAEGHRRHTPGE
jgi:hypothetical protein